jgi:DNA segregation ATPase FtsK/SpoIIIE-like protein
MTSPSALSIGYTNHSTNTGRGTVGIEVPNRKAEIVSMKGLLSSREFTDTKFELPLALDEPLPMIRS